MTTEKTLAGLLSAINEMPDGAWIAPGYDVHNVKRILAASGVAAPVAQWGDPRVQAVYDILCSCDAPPAEQHWEGWTARRIVDALDTPSQPVAAEATAEAARPGWKLVPVEPTPEMRAAGYKVLEDSNWPPSMTLDAVYAAWIAAAPVEAPAEMAEAGHALLAILEAAGEGATVADVLDRLAAPVEVQRVEPVVKYVPVNSKLRDGDGNHPNDDEKTSPECRAALDARGDDEGQGLDGYWKWGFRAGWNAALAGRPAPAAEADDASRPDIVERLTYHAHERDDMTLDDVLDYLASGWKKVHGRTERQLILQLCALLATRPAAPLSEGLGSLADTRHEVNAHANVLRSYIDSLSGEAFQGAIHSLGSLRDIIDGLIAVAALRPTPSNERG